MKLKLILITIFLSCSHLTIASPLKDFCDSDPTGELYSEIWDASIKFQFQSIGLDSSDYQEVIDDTVYDTLFDLAWTLQLSHPEILNALNIWKLKTCITRGYEMLHDL